jgi:predicted nucleic acid-binding protein
MDKIFIDTDICFDLLSARKPFYEAAAGLFSLAEENKITLCISAHSFATLDYLLNKMFTGYQTRALLVRLKVLVKVLAVNEKIIELALTSDFPDFEDAMQYYTAIDNGIKLIITRNLRDYRKAEIPVITAEGYIQSLKK